MKNFKMNLSSIICVLMTFHFLVGQSNLIKGVVIDKKGVPLAGVYIVVNGNGDEPVYGDNEGRYSINASVNDKVFFGWGRTNKLIFYKTIKVEENDYEINVTLDRNPKNIKIYREKRVVTTENKNDYSLSKKSKDNSRDSNKILDSKVTSINPYDSIFDENIEKKSPRNKFNSYLEINKEDTIEELKSLKELLDLELITQEEFDKKSKELKKIILGN